MVKNIWSAEIGSGTAMERWKAKIRRLRQQLRGWAKNVSGAYKKEKKELLDKLDSLDKKAESTLITLYEINLKCCLNKRLTQLLRAEEVKLYQRAKTKELFQGDINTKYFSLWRTGSIKRLGFFNWKMVIRHRGQCHKKYITSYYKSLFRNPQGNDFQLDESLKEDIPQVKDRENETLIQHFIKDEIKNAIFKMEHNKSPRPDGYPAEFYQVFWEILKNDPMVLFQEFHKGNLPLYILNFGIIIFLPKCKEATTIQQYRPICLLNISFKIFTKVATNRIMSVAQKVINPT
jgi:hypothetical protein